MNRQISSANNSSIKNKKLLLFDLEVSGHHIDYIRHIISYLQQLDQTYQVFIVVSPEFFEKFQKFSIGNYEYSCNRLQIIPILKNELETLENCKTLIQRTIKTWTISKTYAQKYSVEHCVFMWFDHILQFPLALHWQFPCSISGICFRPMFHYLQWPDQELTFADRLRGWRQKLLYFTAVRHPKLHTLFCLDPFVPAAINKLSHQNKAVHLPDPVEPNFADTNPDDVVRLKQSLNIAPDRKIFLFFGAIAARKGIFKLFEAIKLLDSNICKKITLLIVGEIIHDKDNILRTINEVQESLPVQIIFHNEFVTNQEMALYFSVADVILALYQKHIGMSGILLQAAAAKRPVISTSFGLMGKMIQQNELGLAVDTTKPDLIADTIKKTLQHSPSDLCNQEKMRKWVQANSPQKFSSVIINTVTP